MHHIATCRAERRHTRSGFTLVEMLLVIVVGGIMSAIAVPRFTSIKREAQLRSAKATVQSYLSVARATAIRKGTTAMLVRDANGLSVLADSITATGARVPAIVLRPTDLYRSYSVALSATRDTIRYNSRGFATELGDGGDRIVLEMAVTPYRSKRDSVCISRVGLALNGSCGL